jgi:hypothetical protein
MLRAPLTCRRLSERDGSGSQAACHQQCSVHRPSRNLAGTSRLLNARRSRSCGRKAAPCGKRRVGLEGRRRRFPESCGETLRPAAAGSSIVRQQRNGMPSDQPVGQSGRSLRGTRPCRPMCRSDWRVWLRLRVAFPFPARPCHGMGDDMDRGKIADGDAPGALNKSHGAYRLTSRMT